MKKIFFIAYGGGHVRMLLPIIKKIMENGEAELVVFGLTTACSVLDAANVPYVSFKNFIDIDECYSACIDVGTNLVGNIQASTLVSNEESIAYHGINFIDLEIKMGLADAKQLYSSNKRQSFYPINFFTKLLQLLKPDLVVATNSPRSERAAIDAAGSLNIPSVCIVDLFALQEISWLGKQNFSTKICVLNESVRNMFLDYGRDRNEIVVTGNPAFDSLHNREFFIGGLKKRQQIGLNGDTKVIFYASQPEPLKHPFCERYGDINLPREIESYLRSFVKINSGYHLIIRYHPSENVEFTESVNVSYSAKSEPLYDILYASDLVVVTASTVGLEASLIGKKVFSVDCSIFTADAPYSKMGISEGVKNVSELGDKIFSATNSNVNASILMRTSESSTDRVISVMDDLLFQ